jgi:hypothetical protein
MDSITYITLDVRPVVQNLALIVTRMQHGLSYSCQGGVPSESVETARKPGRTQCHVLPQCL